ncbi:hypothetical protein DL93DRAFT_2170320 [Clavulina sp. PMI_390]|nr:hypothetical protein DL93DRAFT_2170320 [Clavulina sp. PMI_390]
MSPSASSHGQPTRVRESTKQRKWDPKEEIYAEDLYDYANSNGVAPAIRSGHNNYGQGLQSTGRCPYCQMVSPYATCRYQWCPTNAQSAGTGGSGSGGSSRGGGYEIVAEGAKMDRGRPRR